jgi:hypothetical protein
MMPDGNRLTWTPFKSALVATSEGDGTRYSIRADDGSCVLMILNEQTDRILSFDGEEAAKAWAEDFESAKSIENLDL